MTIRRPRRVTRNRLAIALVALAIGPAQIESGGPLNAGRTPGYVVVDLPSLGGAISEGRHVDPRGVVAGYSDLPGGTVRGAVLWIDGQPRELGTLGGLNSAVIFTDFPQSGPVVGIAETGEVDPRNEAFSCPEFFPGGRPARTGLVCRGFVWDKGIMRPLETLGGRHGFAAGANHRGQVVGWAQTTFEDPACVGDAIFQFLPVIWDAASGQIAADLDLLPGDSSGTANAINDKGQVVGISGDCDQAVGRRSARHAVFWENGIPMDMGNLGADTWNTPLSINQRGEVVGFAGLLNDEGIVFALGAFHWTHESGMQPLPALRDDPHTEAWAINERGQVAGVSCGQRCSAVLWQDRIALDLNDLVQPGYPRHLRTARHINDRGMITGQSEDPVSGERHAFVAMPIQ